GSVTLSASIGVYSYELPGELPMGAIPTQRETTSRAHGAPECARADATLTGSPLAPGSARAVVRAALAEWTGLALPGTEHLTGRAVDDAELIASELVTNAVVHAGTDLRLTCRLEEGTGALIVEVRDRHPSRAPRGDEPETAPHHTLEYGRGLRLVAALCDAWGVTYRPGEKTVWARLPPGGRPGAAGIEACAAAAAPAPDLSRARARTASGDRGGGGAGGAVPAAGAGPRGPRAPPGRRGPAGRPPGRPARRQGRASPRNPPPARRPRRRLARPPGEPRRRLAGARRAVLPGRGVRPARRAAGRGPGHRPHRAADRAAAGRLVRGVAGGRGHPARRPGRQRPGRPRHRPGPGLARRRAPHRGTAPRPGAGTAASVRPVTARARPLPLRSEEHTSELQSRENLVCRLLLE